MKILSLILLIFLLYGCSKPKTVLICGDHVCVNKTEAEQYFEKNLSLEVKILNNKEKKNQGLVELNLKSNEKGEKEVTITPKKIANKEIKILSNKEINKIKKDVKEKNKKKKKVSKNIIQKNDKITNKKILKKEKVSDTKKQIVKSRVVRKDNKFDVCTVLDQCNIEEISKYLINQGKKKKFPDITKRQ